MLVMRMVIFGDGDMAWSAKIKFTFLWGYVGGLRRHGEHGLN